MEKKAIRRVVLSVFAVVFFAVAGPKLTAEAANAQEVQAVASVFDGTYYATNYPDVAASVGGSQLALLNHYIYYGINEGRNASATFNATDYMNKNPDLQLLYGDNMLAYVYHYVGCGKAEGRDATPANPGIETTPEYTLRGVYVTEYNSTIPRATNVELATKNLNGTVVQPGQTFSANAAIGKRTTANGFVEAPVFINKEHAMGIGGGVCQVSSTTYAAMKTAGIEASERHAHSLPVNYLPEGWDATISWGSLDLKFVNNEGSDLLINATANSGILTVAIYQKN
ncbi:MAG: VanW family protein [Pseudobutyrivibrio sp.]|nr:VanW family protein [Pseudobutyrivibrio sp.]